MIYHLKSRLQDKSPLFERELPVIIYDLLDLEVVKELLLSLHIILQFLKDILLSYLRIRSFIWFGSSGGFLKVSYVVLFFKRFLT